MEENLLRLKNEATSIIWQTTNLKDLETLRLKYLGKKGALSLLLKELVKIPVEERKTAGIMANDVKKTIEQAFFETKNKILGESSVNEWFDITKPGILRPDGHLHPLTQTLNEVIKVHQKLGFQVVNGPEIETDHYNFEMVNMGKDSPSRDTQASFYLDNRQSKIQPGEILLRTQTSNMQGRVMEKTKPPMRVLVPGKCFRVDDVDASHSFEFWQFEGFIIDRGINMTHLLGTIEFILKELLPGTEVKFGCTYFAFVEPGVETTVRCTICKGKGCAYCKHNGWSEVLGAGMIHPNVLKNAGINPKEWTGFAYGMGLSRLAILRNQIDDLRVLTNPDLRILKQF